MGWDESVQVRRGGGEGVGRAGPWPGKSAPKKRRMGL